MKNRRVLGTPGGSKGLDNARTPRPWTPGTAEKRERALLNGMADEVVGDELEEIAVPWTRAQL